ncbi:hypothetical protein BJ742DRAFT_795606 [Cladochytrium replicatum]|nr:hypothetical protein BJ742DRAFT_795606 [Cladochytrium replicatum]
MVRNFVAPEGSLVRKTVIITGGSGGIGKVNVRQFAALGAKNLYVFARNLSKTEAILEEIRKETGNSNIYAVQCNNVSLESVKTAAKTFLDLSAKNGEAEPVLHLLVCNAGTAASDGLTENEFESIWQANYLSHFLLTELLLPTLKRTAEKEGRKPGCVRIVNVSSRASLSPSAISFEEVKTARSRFSHIKEYGHSKLAQVIETMSRADELKEFGIGVYSLHPGVVATGIWGKAGVPWIVDRAFKLFFLTEEQGSLTTLYCSTSTESDVVTNSGKYFDDCKSAPHNPVAENKQLQADLKRTSYEWVKQYLSA